MGTRKCQLTDKRRVNPLTFDILAEVRHGCFTRRGGTSGAPYDELNVGDGMGDDERRVARNRAVIQEALDIPHLAFSKQVHGTGIVEVPRGTSGFAGTADALVISEPGQGVMVKHADCQAALIYDPVRKVAAAVHSGWRGSVQNIYGATIRHLRSTHGCRTEDLLVGISPSLGPNAAEFINYRTELPEMFWEHQFKPLHFDFWEISKRQLECAGVLPHHIEFAGICTRSTPDDWFSFRRDKVTGRNGTAISL